MLRAVAPAGDAELPMNTVATSTAAAPARTTLFTRMAGMLRRCGVARWPLRQ
jgi:hypothetical protein